MKILGKKTNCMKLKPESLDDLWVMSTIIEKEDLIRAKTFRKIVLGNKDTEKAKSVKKPMILTIQVEKVSFSENYLKILGIIIEGPEDIPKGSHHSINIEENDDVEITKEVWLNFQKEKIQEAVDAKATSIIACIFNREEAIFAIWKKNNFEIISRHKGTVEKKDMQQQATNFFSEISSVLKEMNERYEPQHIILGSSHFWKNPMQEEVEGNSFSQKCVYTTVDAINESGFSELLTKKEVENTLKDQQAIHNATLVEEIFKRISKDEAVCYGFQDCKRSADVGAIETLLCTDNYIAELRENDDFTKLEQLFKNVDQQQGKIKILSGKNSAVQRLDGIGGVAGILRYKI